MTILVELMMEEMFGFNKDNPKDVNSRVIFLIFILRSSPLVNVAV